MGIEPHHLQRPQNHNFSLQRNNLIDLSNFKQEIRHHLRLFLSDNNNSVVLPNQLRPAPPIDFAPPIRRGSHYALFSVLPPRRGAWLRCDRPLTIPTMNMRAL